MFGLVLLGSALGILRIYLKFVAKFSLLARAVAI